MMTCIDAGNEEPYRERLPYGDHNLLPPDYMTASDEDADDPWLREADGARDVNRDD